VSARHGFVLLALLAVATAVSAQDNPFRLKPGAHGDLCLQCHLDLEDQMKLPSVHSPVEAGDCSDCHDPHASEHGKLLASDPAAICADCHGDMAPQDSASVHQAVIETGCVSCHAAHASENPNILQTAGNDLCFSCHDDLRAELEGHAFQHAPVRSDCLNCHDPHASADAPHLLKAPVGSLCGECHDAQRPSFVERHNGYDVSESDCTSCHDPHGGKRSGILRAQVHEPLTNRMCNQCHMDPGSPEPLQTRRAGLDLCAGCHDDVMNHIIARNRVHWPVLGGQACQNCHNPHASDEAALLARAPLALCGDCHRESIERQEDSLSKHPPIADGQCSACHDPHAADHPFLAKAASSLDLCGSCHDWKTHSSHPLGPEIVDPRNPNLILECESCHQAHGTRFKGLAHQDPGGELCVQCHETMAR
jgi:predicted CXXCH cytochrome family protein